MKKALIILFVINVCFCVKGQDTGSYLHVNVGGGFNPLSYKLTDGSKTTALGYTANLAYSYFFLPQFGLQTGIGMQTFDATSVLNGLYVAPDQDTNGDAYELRMHMKDWTEKQSVIYFDIPLQFQMKSDIAPKLKLLTSIGAKFSIPVYKHYEVTAGEMTTTGYYSNWNLELDNLPQHGFSTITERYKGSVVAKSSCFAIADVGGLVRLSNAMELYIGGYANYRLRNMSSGKSALLYQNDGVYNGVVHSTVITNDKQLAVGGKIGLYFKLGREKPKVKPVPIDTITDTDKDGVPDIHDKCPGTPIEAKGIVDKNGCPLDSDGDGVPDYMDKCPGTPIDAKGMVDKNGCPIDTDGDGVPDYLDRCPNTPVAAKGYVDKNGCPLDTDGDGIPDYLDKCPTIAGVMANGGCPEVKAEVTKLFKKAMQGIQFETGKSVIKRTSFAILNEIASVLLNNPTYLIEVQGHCDNTGNVEENLILSDDRANAVRKYLIGKGVDTHRMTAKGYGDSMPVADNRTSWGRALNRRVEFIVSFEKKISQN